jgi:Ca-activated chloride channel family protein
MKVIALITSCVLCGALELAPSQRSTVVFTGAVTHAVTGAAVAGAHVSIAATSHGGLTDASGHYHFTAPESLRGTTVRLVVASLGYARLERDVQVNGDTVRADFSAAPVALSLDLLVVPTQAAPAMYSLQAFTPGYMQLQHEPWNTEGYDRINENVFRSVAAEPLSTFSIDVDRASYSNIRRFLRGGSLPPVDAVRIEEMINYFPYRPVQPIGDDPFTVVTETAPAPWQPRHLLARVSLFGQPVDLTDIPPGNLVFLIDVSGSMTPDNKLPLVKQSLRLLVNELRPQDRIALVVYAGRAGLVLESTPGSAKEQIMDAIEALEAGGSTAGGAGIRLAYDIAAQHHIAGGNNRVILATDGDFNIGVSSDAEMVRLIEEKRAQGTFLTVLGFGMRNIKDNKLEKLADHGNGNFAYIDGFAEARKVLVEELAGTLLTIAKDVKLQVEFNPQHVRAYRLIGYENRLLGNEDFNDDKKDAGELGAGHTVTALYEIVPVGVEGTAEVREPDGLRYQQRRTRDGARGGDELAFVKLRYKRPHDSSSQLMQTPVRLHTGTASEDLRFAGAVAAFGMVLRNSPHRGQATYASVLADGSNALGVDPGGYRAEFLRLVETAQALSRPVADRKQ